MIIAGRGIYARGLLQYRPVFPNERTLVALIGTCEMRQ
jgi:hypothetical protein